jgi:hydrogenase-1 operon protein HyaE
MTIPMPHAADAAPRAHPLLAQLIAEHGATELDAANFDAFTKRGGHTLLFFAEDPVRYRETLDLAVIAPEIARAFAGRFALGVLLPEAARTFHARYGFRRWPALVLLKDGQYVGAIDGLRDWDGYLDEMERLLAAAPTRPPAIGIAVKGDHDGSTCGT